MVNIIYLLLNTSITIIEKRSKDGSPKKQSNKSIYNYSRDIRQDTFSTSLRLQFSTSLRLQLLFCNCKRIEMY